MVGWMVKKGKVVLLDRADLTRFSMTIQGHQRGCRRCNLKTRSGQEEVDKEGTVDSASGSGIPRLAMEVDDDW